MRAGSGCPDAVPLSSLLGKRPTTVPVRAPDCCGVMAGPVMDPGPPPAAARDCPTLVLASTCGEGTGAGLASRRMGSTEGLLATVALGAGAAESGIAGGSR